MGSGEGTHDSLADVYILLSPSSFCSPEILGAFTQSSLIWRPFNLYMTSVFFIARPLVPLPVCPHMVSGFSSTYVQNSRISTSLLVPVPPGTFLRQHFYSGDGIPQMIHSSCSFHMCPLPLSSWLFLLIGTPRPGWRPRMKPTYLVRNPSLLSHTVTGLCYSVSVSGIVPLCGL